jgi:hypothetical protein
VKPRDRLAAELLALLERIVDARVDARLAQLGVAVDEYTSGRLPRGMTRRTFNEWCRSGKVDGASRDGREWRCIAAAWRAARAAAAPTRESQQVAANDAVPDLDAMLSGAGMRRTKGTAS